MISRRVTQPRGLYYRPGERFRYNEPFEPNPNFYRGTVPSIYTLTLLDDIKFYGLYLTGAVGGKTESMVGMAMNIGL